MITVNLLYWISFLVPLLVMPIVLPLVVLMAHRKRLTDMPNSRKLQSQPVPVMGGTVIMLAVCTTCIVLNVIFSISGLFSAMCVMMMLYIFGMLDDNIGLSWQFKFVLQILSVLLLFFGGDYGVHSMYGLFGLGDLPYMWSCLVSLFVGLLLLNAVNFSDGIDGLASGIGVLSGLVIGYWNVRHDELLPAMLSFCMVGAMAGFFMYNVFSSRFKMYMGDSGSLVLGFFIYTLTCTNVYVGDGANMLADRYMWSFFIAVLSYIIFDLIRVASMRVLHGKSPFQPDRTHLHHMYVDLGNTHLMATFIIIMNNILVIGIWYLTATMEIAVEWQSLLTIVSAMAVYWLPYAIVTWHRNNRPEAYARMQSRIRRISAWVVRFEEFMSSVVDLRLRRIRKA